MNIPDPIICTGVASLIGLQAWIVRELFALKQAIAELRGQKHRTSRRHLGTLLLIISGPWLGFLLLVGCGVGVP